MQNPIFILRISDKYCILEQNLVCYKIELKTVIFCYNFILYKWRLSMKKHGDSKLQEQNDCVVYSRYANCGSGFLFSDYTCVLNWIIFGYQKSI